MFAEFRFAARALARWRGGAVAAALTLAIGIGTTTGLYALVRVLLADMPGVPALDRVARIYASSQALGVERSPVALNEFDQSLSKAASFAAIGAYSSQEVTLGTGPDVRSIVAGYASPGFFAAMGVAPAQGRVFSAGDLDAERPVALVSDTVWRRQFAGTDLSNARVTVDGVSRAVIGVMPPEFSYSLVGVTGDVWLPLGRAGQNTPAIVTVFGRLRDGVSWPAAADELQALSRGRGPWTWHAIPIAQDTRTRAMNAYAGALGPAVLILLIACINVACMLMARGIEREKELTVRRALGATRLRIVRLLLTENLVLALASGALGSALAAGILRVLASELAAYQPSLASSLAVDARLLPVALIASGMACLFFGTVPAVRLSKRDVAASLNGVPAVHRLQIAGYGARDVIVFGEIAAAVGFIVWTAMLYTLFSELNGMKLTFPAEHVVTMRVPAGTARQIASRVSGVPGVASTAISSGMLGGGTRVRVEGSGGKQLVVSRMPVDGAFLETLGVPLVRGRGFDATEQNAHAGVAIVTESGARQLDPGGNALGLRLKTAMYGEVLIVGVCRDPVDYGAVAWVDGFTAELYVPYEPSAMSREAVVLARLAGDPHVALGAIAVAVQTPPGTRPSRPTVLADDFRERTGNGGALRIMKILGAFAVLTLLLAASGVFAVISQSVAQRTREFGIRMAIGATPTRILTMVLTREGKLIVAALGTGLLFTMALTRALFVELTSLNAIVPSLWVAALIGASAVAGTACLLASWRIVRLDPAVVLRRT